MELPYRKSRNEEENDTASEESNDVRSSLQGPLREGGNRVEDAGFLGGGGPPTSAARRALPTVFCFITTLIYTVC